jgi:hypothetical protein
MLDRLDPLAFKNYEVWLKLMMACHHASNGDARQEFISWSIGDPQYADDEQVIGSKWDGLHADAAAARVTYRTLDKFLRDVDADDAIPGRTTAQDDFGDADEPDLPDTNDDASPLERMNREWVLALEGSKPWVMHLSYEPDLKRSKWERLSEAAFKLWMRNRKIQKKNKKGEWVAIPTADAWLDWAGRRQVKGVVFDPEREQPGYLNLWTGWGVKPKHGDWSLMQRMIREVLCNDDQKSFDYVMNWMAAFVQRPWLAGRVAIYFTGAKGIGKSTLGRVLCRLAGRHGMHISSAEHLTGRFNDHLRDLVMLFADEAIKVNDYAGKRRLKALITEPSLVFEGKGRDVNSAPNRIHVVSAANESGW